MKIIATRAACVLALLFPALVAAQNQLPSNFLGMTALELGPNITGGAENDLVTGRFHQGHSAASVRPNTTSTAAGPSAAAAATIPVVSPQRVVGAGASATGFAGLSHFDQRFAGTGNYANTQFSLEPPDQGLCAGNGFVVETVNNAIAVYTPSGKRVGGPKALSQFFNLAPEVIRPTGPYGPVLTDPRCYFDTATRRWFVTELEIETVPTTGAFASRSHVLVAVSLSADPTSGWYVFSFETTSGTGSDLGHAHCPCFGDQPLLGADANGIYISTNEFPIAGAGFNGAQIYALSKAALTSGVAPTVVHFNVGGTVPTPPPDLANGGVWYTVQPATSPRLRAGWEEGESQGVEYFLSALQFGPAPFDNRIAVWALSNTGSLNTVSPRLKLLHTVISSESYGMSNDFAAVQKPGPTPLRDALGDTDPLERLNANDDRMNQVVFADGHLWSGVNTNVMVGGMTRQGIAWFAVTPSLDDGALSARMHRQGYAAANNVDVFFPSIGVTEDGNAAMGFSLSGPGYWPSAAYTKVGDGAADIHVVGAGRGPEDGFTGYAAYGGNGVARWGDYSAAVADERGNIWLAAEYIGQTCTLAQFLGDTTCGGTRSMLANWGTFITRVRVQEDD
jgi:hypothetical protein